MTVTARSYPVLSFDALAPLVEGGAGTATTSGIIYDYAMNGIWDRVNKGVRSIIPEAVAAAGPCWRRS